jgi:sugar phosphate isomerase/epimerase
MRHISHVVRSFVTAAITVAVPLLLPSLAAAAGKSQVQVGLCTGKDFDKAKAAGFEYAELGVRNFAQLPEAEFTKFVETFKASGLKAPVANVFLPGELKVVGPDTKPDAQMEYVKQAFARSEKLGIKTIVFGSGGSRKVPDGWSKDEAMKQLVDFAKRIAPEAKKRGIVVAVEPLRQQETNIINTAAEGLAWVKAVGHPNFQLMIDFYHLSVEKEDPEIVVTAGKSLKHIHIANPTGRVYPLAAGEADYATFFRKLNQIGYRGGISVEAGTKKFDDEGPKAVAFLKAAYAEAGKATPKPAPKIKQPAAK